MRHSLLLLVLASAQLDGAQARQAGPTAARNAAVEQRLTVPLGFEVNVGQFADEVRFVARGEDFSVTLRDHEVVLHYANTVPIAQPDNPAPRSRSRAVPSVSIGTLPMRFVGAKLRSPVAIEELPGELHYIATPHQDLRRYAKVIYKEIYPGIDLVFHRARGVLEYDLEVAPGADPSVIELEFPGAPEPQINSAGELVVSTPGGGRFRHGAPALEEENGTARREVAGRWRLTHGKRAGFHVGAYDKRRRLRIDPTIVFQGSVGGRLSPGVGRDAQGNAYVAGNVLGELGPVNYIAKFAPDGSFVGQGFFPGDCTGILDIDADAQGRVYVAGATCAGDLPTVNAYQDSLPPNLGFGEVAFLARLGTNLSSVEYGTYFGGTQPGLRGRIDDAALSVAAGADGIAAVSGWAESADFPTTASGYQRSNQGFLTPWVAKFDTNAARGASLVYSTLLGSPQGIGEGKGVALDAGGFLYVTGYIASPAGSVFPTKNGFQSGPPAGQPAFMDDGFLAKFDPNAAGEASLLYSTLLGGIRSESSQDVAVDAGGHAYLTGFTTSIDFPTSPGAVMLHDPDGTQQSVFMAKMNPAAAGLASRLWSTYFGSGFGLGAAVDGQGRMYATGFTAGLLPSVNPIPPNQGLLFLASLSGSGGVIYSTRLGRGIPSRVDVVVDDATSTAYVGGSDGGNFLIAVRGEAPAVVTILPSTTRWRPQRDTTKPIKIEFSSAKPLKSATVNISGPATVEPIQATFEQASPPSPYKIEWTTTDSTGKPLPAGDYKVNIVGQPESGDPINSDPKDHFVSLVEVKEQTLRLDRLPANSPLDTNPGAGEGLRILPEADAPGGQVGDKDKVRVIASIFPAVPDPGSQGPVKVYFRGIDVDDPSATRKPVDDESLDHDNCADGGCAVPKPGRINGTDAENPVAVEVPNGAEEVTAIFQVSERQGDNFRVASSTSDTWLKDLTAKQSSPSGEVVHAKGDELVEGTHFTQMLTVWRTLHLEIDHLDSGAIVQTKSDPGFQLGMEVLDITGTISKLAPQTLTDATAPFVVKPPKGFKGPVDHSSNHSWVWADLWPKSSVDPSVKVTGNGKDNLDVSNQDDLTKLAQVGDEYRLSDDRKVDLTGALPLELMKTILGQAYMQVDVEGSMVNPTPVIPFKRNLADRELLEVSTKNVSNTESFWSVLVVDAFDGPLSKDNDPNDPKKPKDPVKNEPGTLGLTGGAIPPGGAMTQQDLNQPICGVFRETIRDSTEEQGWKAPVLERVTAHEVLCHAMGNWDHERATLCHETHLEGFTGAEISEDHLAFLRRLKQPRWE